MWQTLRSEWHPQGLEIVTVALDTAGIEAAHPWIEAANPDHPSLIDQAHLLDELLGVVNVPNGVWIDEQGMIVRPPEPAYPRRPTADTTAPSILTKPIIRLDILTAGLLRGFAELVVMPQLHGDS